MTDPASSPPGDDPHGDDRRGPSPSWGEVERLLDTALELDPAEWSDFLTEACGDDAPELRDEVASLLARHPRIGGFLEEPPAEPGSGPAASRPPATSLTGRRLGPYRIVEDIAQGGMADVFLAERADGRFEQRVAVKLLRAGLQTEEMVRRFRVERKILAGVEHPSVARLVDGGVTDDGRPYLVTEYVEGVPVDRYCDERGLPVRQRLRLFLEVAEAVHHAHRNLVIHRDLKPSNILVDASGRVKLLDFGIAKLLEGDEEGAAEPITRPGRRWMTREYAAPEQVTCGPVTTATDVYQLGVVLYELLSGRHPFEDETASPHRLERAVVETVPERPSTAAVAERDGGDRSPEGSPGPDAVARARATRPAELRRTLEGDLDAVVLKALRKDPEDRYGSAGALAEDVERHLAGRPVAARRATPAYRARKFVARHQWGVGAAALLLLLLAGFAVFATVQADRVARERDRARQATAFVTSLLRELEPVRSPGTTADPKELLDRAVERGREQLADQPLLRAELFDALGEVHQNRGLFDEADDLLEEALRLRRRKQGPDHLSVAESQLSLGILRARRGRPSADSLLGAAAATYRRKLGPDSPELQWARVHRALALRDRGDFAAAASLFREVIAATRGGPGSPPSGSRRTALTYLGKLLTWAGKHEEADELLSEALRRGRARHGEAHPVVANILEATAELALARGDVRTSEETLLRVQAMRRDFFRDDHPDLAAGHLNLGRVRLEDGDPAGAEAELREALEVYRRDLGETSRGVALVLRHLARARWARGDRAGADSLSRQALAIWRDGPRPPRHPYLADLLLDRARRRLAGGRSRRAAALAREAGDVLETTRPVGAPRVLEARGWVGAALASQGRHAEAEARLRASYVGLLRAVGPDHPLTREAADRLGKLPEEEERGTMPAAPGRRSGSPGTSGDEAPGPAVPTRRRANRGGRRLRGVARNTEGPGVGPGPTSLNRGARI